VQARRPDPQQEDQPGVQLIMQGVAGIEVEVKCESFSGRTIFSDLLKFDVSG
jgi:hypothetical protein